MEKNAKEGAKSGALWALPVVGSTLLGSRSSRLDFSIKNCIAFSGIGCLPFYLSAILSWSYKNEAALNMATAEPLQSKPRTDIEQRVIKSHGKAIKRKIFFANGAACTWLSAAIIAIRIKKILDG